MPKVRPVTWLLSGISYSISYRLRGQKLEGALVAPGRLAISPLLLRVWGYRLPVAAIGQQQQMSYFRRLSYPRVLIISRDISHC